ncbi:MULTISPECIES: UbiA prenyltransferase family protein [Clostridium]|uniref:UbiA prenyltransferase family protein n=1 Tax=Clostridium TaxID=1485 RepID=UPI0002CB4943|nr:MULTISPECIES: UbiA prenyltransferase family protein [Clostridium]EMU55882.1 prenyltransferase, UbiA family [Clostridium butyricum DKU-01]KJZ84779.1 UbiA prenyltransferase family protein [Clostridium sp. IBUN125C]KJZ85178.1 UbiA prenyltransferase family protein [Clostridium sp. IBUN22A]KJZ95854.1 UbiA prenyltransferase family protein [Clostridium sp. IBUN62F]KJZ97571.1 hypothetical protein ClosIBUN13A_CONTIG112g01639 [Clostridium sp. IBUN13A]
MNKLFEYLKLMRVHHYLKNVLIFLPIVFSKNLFEFELAKKTILGFIAFSIISSIVYIINDIQDVEKDKQHPKKCKRPIASGAVSIRKAYILSLFLFVVGILIMNNISDNSRYSLFLMMLYLGMNFLYSIKLKHYPIVDITILSLGFLIRVLFGAACAQLEVSKWLCLTVIAMSFYLGLGKRRNELKRQGNLTRSVLKYYNKEFLDKNMYMCLSLTIVFYSLWCVDPMTIYFHSNQNIIFTVPLVIVICMKYSLNIEGDSDGDPVSVILQDKILIILLIIYISVILSIIYLI